MENRSFKPFLLLLLCLLIAACTQLESPPSTAENQSKQQENSLKRFQKVLQKVTGKNTRDLDRSTAWKTIFPNESNYKNFIQVFHAEYHLLPGPMWEEASNLGDWLYFIEECQQISTAIKASIFDVNQADTSQIKLDTKINHLFKNGKEWTAFEKALQKQGLKQLPNTSHTNKLSEWVLVVILNRYDLQAR